MHILLISACEKRALKKTRAVLDSYALRAGEKTWVSPITVEGMRELRSALKRVATRQTAVACYANEGRSRMRLLWIVGARHRFGHRGHFPAGTQKVTRRVPVPDWIRAVALLAKAGGYGHDLGKNTQGFQKKLTARQAIQDIVRHEWISVAALRRIRNQEPIPAIWPKAEVLKPPSLWAAGPDSPENALDYLVGTHHRLFGPLRHGADKVPDRSNHIFDDSKIGLDDSRLQAASPFPEAVLKRIEATVARLPRDKGADFWRAASVLARAALIFADHLVSSRWQPGGEGAPRANTGTDPLTKKPGLNQDLWPHLQGVGDLAGEVAYRMATLRLPSLSDAALDCILAPATQPRFLWQNRGVNALARLREESSAPVLVLNMAGTGAGKTRANAKCVCALAERGRVRFATVLNLRSLTLQTGSAYVEQLGIGPDECSTIIGDRHIRKLYEHGRKMDEEDCGEVEFENTGFDFVPPAWLEGWFEQHPGQKGILGVPVLVSTIDFLIAAGEPLRQAHHVSALLRLMDSDIILDEVDNYDPKALVAVLRLIQMAALLGRNVVCSSATLAFPVALAVHQAFQSGIRLRAALVGGVPSFQVALVDNLAEPEVFAGEEDFAGRYQGHLKTMFAAMEPVSYRRAALLKIGKTDKEKGYCQEDWLQAVLDGVGWMHGNNRWAFADTGKQVSFGLVRIANIGTAIEVARFLAKKLPHARVACYHSGEFMVQRFMKEKRLDKLLTRHGGNGAIKADPEIRSLVMGCPAGDLPFIVVATPVEEIGRDHDFDWAVIEPSSIQSIIQTAGRVNRHRLEPRTFPNISILQRNYRWIRNKMNGSSGTLAVFKYPGLETDGGGLYRTDKALLHDLGKLLPWNEAGELPSLDARLRFNGCQFARLDDKSIEDRLKPVMPILFETGKIKPQVMVEGVYQDYPLRDRNAKTEWVFLEDKYQVSTKVLKDGKPEFELVPRSSLVKVVQRAANDWLAWDNGELEEFCRQAGLELEKGFSVEVIHYGKAGEAGDGAEPIEHDKSFGFRRR